VLIEHRDPSRGEYEGMPAPTLQASVHTRWSVAVPANGEATFTVREREIHTSGEDIRSWNIDYITGLQSAGVISEPVATLLQRLASETQRISTAQQQIAALQEEYRQLLALQEQLRKNLSALGGSEREVVIRDRVLDDLETSENRRRTIESTLIDLDRQIKQGQADQHQLVDEIFRQTS
jgi:chromosome segregation ATPase